MTKKIFEQYFKEWLHDLKEHKWWIIKVANVEVDIQSYWDKYEEMYPDNKPEALERELIQRWLNYIFSLPSLESNAFWIIDLIEGYWVNPVMVISTLLLKEVAILEEMQKTENLPLLNQTLVQKTLWKAMVMWALITIYANKDSIIKYEEKKSVVEEIKAEVEQPSVL